MSTLFSFLAISGLYIRREFRARGGYQDLVGDGEGIFGLRAGEIDILGVSVGESVGEGGSSVGLM